MAHRNGEPEYRIYGVSYPSAMGYMQAVLFAHLNHDSSHAFQTVCINGHMGIAKQDLVSAIGRAVWHGGMPDIIRSRLQKLPL